MIIPLKELTFSVRFMEVIEGLLQERHAPLSVLLNALRLTEAQLHDPSQTIDGEQYQRALVAALPYCLPGQSVAEQYLTHVPLTIIGPLASLLMACANLGEALEAVEQYCSVLFPAYSMSREETQDEVRIVVSRLSDFGEVDDLLTEIVLGLFSKFHSFLAEPLDGVEYHFRHDKGAHPLILLGDLIRKVHYGARVDMVAYPKRLMAISLVTKSRVMRKEAERSLGELLKRDELARPCSQQVRRVIRDLLVAGKVLHGDVVADQVALSRRTLNRRLEDEGSTLASLMTEVRMSFAETLLLTTTLPVMDIARLCGFTEMSNFSRAFKRFFGCTPRERRDR
ncbi:MAG: helix-turn-helix domain-containing protein [Aquabacterium sp.]|nr:helix-turn-helix domain-containing protein [Aquabacterium sp.]